MTVRVGINGFGRIGRNFLRAAHGAGADVEIVAINDLVSPDTNAHLLRYDSTHGRFSGKVASDEHSLTVDGHEIAVFAHRDPSALPWDEYRVDVVVESTGRFTKRAAAAAHIDAGAKRVVISAPADDADATFVVGVNDDAYDPAKDIVVSNASCTTNCFVPMVKVLDDAFGLAQGLMTTVHAYTNDQELLDLARDDLRRSRAAAVNIVPTSTGAARATRLVMAAMAGRLDGVSLRVPVQDGSITDLTGILNAEVDAATVNAAFSRAASSGPLAKVLDYTDEPIVSRDIVGSPASCTFDSELTKVIPIGGGQTLVKVFGWYDNEWGYSNRLVDLVEIIGVAVNGHLPLLEDLLPLEGKRVLVRVDFNVPILEAPDGSRRAGDDFRIRAALPTLEFLLAHGASVTACTHLGRPEGRVDEHYSVAPVAARLAELAPAVELLENLRFDPGEEANDPMFAKRLADGFDCFVNDAFGVSHRPHASVVGVPELLPSAAGRLLAREAEVLGGLMEDPKRPFVAIVGGAKVADKLGVVHALAARVDTLIIGGGMAYTFLAALGHEIGSSLYDPSRREECQEVLASPATVLLPEDCVGFARDPERVACFGRDIPPGYGGLDIGPHSAARFAEAIASAATVLWNGPMGVFEDPRFSSGTRAVAEAVAACPGFTVVGGGDSVAAIDEWGLGETIDHLSTGGGASLEMIEFGDLPGLAALRDAARRVGATTT